MSIRCVRNSLANTCRCNVYSSLGSRRQVLLCVRFWADAKDYALEVRFWVSCSYALCFSLMVKSFCIMLELQGRCTEKDLHVKY